MTRTVVDARGEGEALPLVASDDEVGRAGDPRWRADVHAAAATSTSTSATRAERTVRR
jgi:hypothetical protein